MNCNLFTRTNQKYHNKPSVTLELYLCVRLKFTIALPNFFFYFVCFHLGKDVHRLRAAAAELRHQGDGMSATSKVVLFLNKLDLIFIFRTNNIVTLRIKTMNKHVKHVFNQKVKSLELT